MTQREPMGLAMAVRISPVGRQQFFDNQGRVAAGMKLFTYAATTATKLATFTSSTGGVQNANPIVLDSAGRTPSGLWLTDGTLYKFVLAPANDTDPPTSPIWSEDNINAGDATLTSLATSAGAALIGWIYAFSGAVASTVQNWISWQPVNVFGFMTVAQIADVQARTMALDVTAAIQAALDATNTGGEIYFPRGTYKITSTLTVKSGQTLTGTSRGVYSGITGSVLRGNTASLKLLQIQKGSAGVLIQNLMFWGSSTTYLASTVAILMQGSSAAGDSAINGVRIANCGFWRWEKAIYGGDTAVGGFQVSSIHIVDCVLGECLYGAYLDSSNADYWLMDNCTGSCAVNGSIIYVNRGGDIGIRNTTGSGADATTTAFLTINGGSAPIYVERCQAESIKYFLLVNSGGAGARVVMNCCVINGDILFTPQGALMFIACDVTNPVTMSADGRVIDLMSTWTLAGALTLNTNSFAVAEIGVNRPSNTSQVLAKFKAGSSVARLLKSQAGTIAIDSRLATEFCLNITAGTAFTVGNPTVEPDTTPRITIQVKNSSGGAMGVITWDTLYKMSAWTNPANGFSRAIDFQYDGTNWIQISQTGVDVPN